MLLANPQRFVKVRLPIRHVNPLAPPRCPAGRLEGGSPSLGFSRTAQTLPARLSFGRGPGPATRLVEQSHHHALGSLLQRPRLNPHRQGTVQLKPAAVAIANPSQILCGRMPAVIQQGRSDTLRAGDMRYGCVPDAGTAPGQTSHRLDQRNGRPPSVPPSAGTLAGACPPEKRPDGRRCSSDVWFDVDHPMAQRQTLVVPIDRAFAGLCS